MIRDRYLEPTVRHALDNVRVVMIQGALAWLRDRLGDRFVAGVVLYPGALSLPLGDRIDALPMSTLWEA